MANGAKIGRPAIGKYTAVRLPVHVIEAIDSRCGKGRRAEFIRKAVVAAIDADI